MPRALAPPSDLAREPWAALAVLGRLLTECVLRSTHGYVLIVAVRRKHELPGPGYRVYTSLHGKRHVSGGDTLEVALERAVQRLVGTD
jgi:hypothetical protein